MGKGCCDICKIWSDIHWPGDFSKEAQVIEVLVLKGNALFSYAISCVIADVHQQDTSNHGTDLWFSTIPFFNFYGLDIFKPGPRLNIKTVLSTYGDFHVKDKTAVRTSYL